MSIISVFSGVFCKAEQVIEEVRSSTGLEVLSDSEAVKAAHEISGISAEKIRRAFAARTSVFNKFTHEKECSVAYLRLALADRISKDNLIINGFAGQLIPTTISHLLRVALIGDVNFRLGVAAQTEGLSEKQAQKRLRSHDEDCAAWIDYLHRAPKDCWDPELYDLFIPMNKTSVEHASALIAENVLKPVLQTTPASQKAVKDFRLAAEVEVALVGQGHNVDVSADGGAVTLSIHKQVLMLGRLEDELRAIASKVNGVDEVDIKASHTYHQANIYRKHDFSLPDRVLLVDDERDLVQTLSERLQMRDMGSAVAYDGESALKLVRDDDPEVMIIDLKMPGIDGLEVLRKVKETRPQIEVIILTGQGSEDDKAQCLELGAFGYLQKPVDIEKLSDMLKRAHDKIRAEQ
ncbi:MAG: response regulator [Desulfobacteraceae bacterium]|jgi:CheY-like chemotaxis protein